ncbi:nucleotide sugar dehydrogenase [Sphingomonas kyeonggiensis]|uniref:UDP-N-acetyl-D-mannosaminuronic acid dehydrogenase n=1 Tax=Sphingomonas kyeonggiensis TaxID=1268553 RepID=A0A7W6JUX1_9SPHN|nr:nucleotide sugar dehydrogenase [Sphingomonas kyeonggiensis]MBB4099940.1 UDP-N-acetyl-D-mannosaminuronic acid dehydrogenase [Sphingomonas kyeonggiensis]
MKDIERVAVVGLGYVGLTLAVAMAQRGIEVVGVERRPEVVDLTNAGKPHFSEQGLDEILDQVVKRGSLKAFTSFSDVAPCDAYVITVGTPLGADGNPRLDMVESATREVVSHMADGALIVLRSTVKLGTTREVVARVLEESGRSGFVAMCPERTLEGDALREIANLPQIVGGLTDAATDRAASLFGKLTNSVVRVASPETAEMIKLIDNTYRDVRFAFANEVARACDAVGVNANDVIGFGKLGYPRTNVALPGLVGGPCLEKDPHILRHSLAQHGVDMEVTGAARKVNERQPHETVAQAFAIARARNANAPLTIALAGLAFKGVPETDDLRGSMALHVIDAIRAQGHEGAIRVYDPVVQEQQIGELGLGLEVHGDLEGAAEGAHILFIANNHPSYRKVTLDRLAGKLGTNGFIYDYWNHFGHEMGVQPGRYVTVGNLVAGEKAA